MKITGKPKFHTGLEYMQLSEDEKPLRIYDQHSDVLPDQSLSLREIVNRSLMGGMPLLGRDDGYYNEDEEPDPVGGYDLTDLDFANNVFQKFQNYERAKNEASSKQVSQDSGKDVKESV